MADQALTAMRDMCNAAQVVNALSSSPASTATCAMLDALIDSYKLDLMHVTVDGLVRLQAAILQTQAIRNVVAGDTQDIPKI